MNKCCFFFVEFIGFVVIVGKFEKISPVNELRSEGVRINRDGEVHCLICRLNVSSSTCKRNFVPDGLVKGISC